MSRKTNPELIDDESPEATDDWKRQLMTELSNWIAEHQLKQADGVAPSRVRCRQPKDGEVHELGDVHHTIGCHWHR